MAKHYYGLNIGAGFDPQAVTTGTSTTSKDVELVITDAVSGMTKMEVLKAIEALEAYVEKNNAPV